MKLYKHKVNVPVTSHIKQPTIEWIFENFGQEDVTWQGDWSGPSPVITYYFRHKKDAVFFALKWTK